jgi:hypothetical protein
LLKSISGQSQSWFIYLISFMPLTMASRMTLKIRTVTARNKIKLPGMSCRQWGLRVAGREHGAPYMRSMPSSAADHT